MFVLLAIVNDIFKTYFDSLKRDLGESGFKMVLIIALNAWAGGLLIFWLLLTHNFQMPADPQFYFLWFGLTLLTEISYTLLLIGMLNTTFFAASSFANIGFAITAIYAWLILHERYNLIQILALIIIVAGSLLFFKKGVSKKLFTDNKGIFLIFFSLLLTPLEYILYKAATLHATSYHQFLTGRLTMDWFFYTLFFVIITIFWYRKNPLPQIRSFLSSPGGIVYVAGHTATELLESWLIFKIPISLFTILGTISIPTAYFVGRKKYKEPLNWRYVAGAILVALGVILFVLKSNHLVDF
jgi:drug/metabolite transporter (DMT)-like permease